MIRSTSSFRAQFPRDKTDNLERNKENCKGRTEAKADNKLVIQVVVPGAFCNCCSLPQAAVVLCEERWYVPATYSRRGAVQPRLTRTSCVFFPEMANCEAADLNYNLRLREGTLHSGPPRIQELQIHAEIGADDQICFGSPCMCAGSAKSFGNSSEQSKVPWPLAPYMFSPHSLGLFPIRHLSSNSVER